MLFIIANALNDPYGYDIQDIKLNRLSSETALAVLDFYSTWRMNMSELIKPNAETPCWLEDPPEPVSAPDAGVPAWKSTLRRIFKIPSLQRRSSFLILAVLGYTAWIAFVVFLTFGLSKVRDAPEGIVSRWWYLYIPIDSSTTSFVGLGIFLLLGFWINDAYGRFGRGLQLWQHSIRRRLESASFYIAMTAKPGLWHERDRERILSFFAAIPYVVKQHLRQSRDISELEGILSPEDLSALGSAPNLPMFCFNVLYAYINSADSVDKNTLRKQSNPFRTAIFGVHYGLWEVERAVEECESLLKFPISKFFTIHLTVFTMYWLAVLPLSLVLHDGFLSFLFMIPIGYSIIKLVALGNELADPFGTDPNDIPLETLCNELKEKMKFVYDISRPGPVGLVHESDYKREDFVPSPRLGKISPGELSKPAPKPNSCDNISSFVKEIIEKAPIVDWKAQIVVTLWAIAATFISYGFSFTWDKSKRDLCRGWCSPIDVKGDVLVNTGFALFLILGFRASDGISRYETGADLIFDLSALLRSITMEMLLYAQGNGWHPGDRERILAHIVQIPIEFCDSMLGIKRSAEEKKGLISDEDREEMERSSDPVSYLVRVVEAYVLTMDTTDTEHAKFHPNVKAPGPVTARLFAKTRGVRDIIGGAQGIKRFPVVTSYTRHQWVFTVLWLAMLPLAMAPATGFFTILWAPLISYGVLSLENIAKQLADPFGTDAMDLPLEQMCNEAANDVLEAIHSTDWDCTYHVKPSPRSSDARIGTLLVGDKVVNQYDLPRFDDSEDSKLEEEVLTLRYSVPERKKETPTFATHFFRSIPWWPICFATAWSAVAVIISYILKEDAGEVRWWQSRIVVSSSVISNISIASKFAFVPQSPAALFSSLRMRLC